jgi:pyruvate kinase
VAGRRARVDGLRRTRIVATLGPASRPPAMLRRLIRAGVDVFRLNFSHGSHASHAEDAAAVRAASDELGMPVALLADLCGPKLRLGRVQDDAVQLRTGSTVLLREDAAIGTSEHLSAEAAGLVSTLVPGRRVLIADGAIELRVARRQADGVACRVVHGGLLRSRQGINIPGRHAGVEALTPKDRRDLACALSLGVDAVALSFVRGADDVLALRRLLDRRGARPFVIAKIERAEALENLGAILEVVGGVMVARGDLGVEIGVANVPLAQKRIIREALRMHRPVITATQMLESMIERPVPTRAEVSDIANAVLEGTDALMLSAETAVGSHPLEAVSTLAQVALQVERAGMTASAVDIPAEEEDTAMAIARAARIAARSIRAGAVAAFTESGRTARLVSSQRPTRRLFGFTDNDATLRRMKFFWGITPLRIRHASTTEAMVAEAEALLLQRGLMRRGERLVVVCGEVSHAGATNTVKIHTMGDAASPAGIRSQGSGGNGAAQAGSRRSRNAAGTTARRKRGSPLGAREGHATH